MAKTGVGGMKPVFKFKAVGVIVEVYDNKILLTPKGLSAFILKGLKGTKTIPFSSIKALQLKEAGLLKGRGYLQFTLTGGPENQGGILAATMDENTFLFRRKHNKLVKEIRDFIEARMHEPRHPVRTTSLGEELQQLSELRDRGVLSEQEFQSAKKKLVGAP